MGVSFWSSVLCALELEGVDLRRRSVVAWVVFHRVGQTVMAAVWMAATAAAIVQVSAVARAQSTSGADGSKMAFDVASIRPSKPNSSWAYGIGPDNLRIMGLPLSRAIIMAYFPDGYGSKDRISGAPDWVRADPYDIVGKVAPPDQAEWQKQRLALANKVMLQGMLQALLADRCKLVVHRVPAEIQGYALVIAKRGPKLTETPADETLPTGVRMPGGGILVPYQRGEAPRISYFGVSMATFAQNLKGFVAAPVVDQTGLTGKYDFVLDGRVDVPSGPDPNNWDFDQLGLELKPVKLPTETIVIDHIERPSAN